MLMDDMVILATSVIGTNVIGKVISAVYRNKASLVVTSSDQ